MNKKNIELLRKKSIIKYGKIKIEKGSNIIRRADGKNYLYFWYNTFDDSTHCEIMEVK
jgi:hypothetical protein